MNYREDMDLVTDDFIQNPIVGDSQSDELIPDSPEPLPLLAWRKRVFCQG